MSNELGPVWFIGNVYYRVGITGGHLLIGQVAIDPMSGPIGYVMVPDERLERIAAFDVERTKAWVNSFQASAKDYVAAVAEEDKATWEHRIQGFGNAMSMFTRADLSPSIAGGDRMAELRDWIEKIV